MTDPLDGLREVIRTIVREELDRARAEARPDAEEMLTTVAAAVVAGVCPKTVRRWISEGRLTEHRAGRELRVRRGDLNALMRGEGDMSPEQLADVAVRRRFGS